MKLNFAINKREMKQSNNAQEVSFFYTWAVIKNVDIPPEGGAEYSSSPGMIEKQDYSLLRDNSNIFLLNYTKGGGNVTSPLGQTSNRAYNFTNMNIYKREFWEEDGETKSETIYSLVAANFHNSSLLDFNIANNRNYEYLAYPSGTETEGIALTGTVQIKWSYWSITELHPVNNSKTEFTAAPEDVWLFKYNMSAGEMNQNISKTQQDNLTAYPVFAHGLKNHLSGSVSCLLGSEIKPYVYTLGEAVYDEVAKRWVLNPSISTTFEGGYTEKLRYSSHGRTSNQEVDMLKAWRDIAYSGNPKLLKDLKGQKFLVQITQSSSTIQDTWHKMPTTISFSWVEIGNLDGVTITNGNE